MTKIFLNFFKWFRFRSVWLQANTELKHFQGTAKPDENLNITTVIFA